MSQVLQFIHNGGVMMYPLIACSILVVALAIERFISLRRASVDGFELIEQVKELYKPSGGGNSVAA